MKPTLKFLCGLPGSGKSTYANRLAEEGYVIISSDELRKELYGSYEVFDKNEELFTELHKRVKENLAKGNNVCYDATGINRKKRIHFLNHELKDIDCVKECVIMATPYNMCIQQDKLREKKVGKEVIKRMYFNFQPPMKQEGWTSISILYHPEIDWSDKEYNSTEMMYFLTNMNQFNSHHKHTVGQHCFYVAAYIARKTERNDLSLIDAGYLHDISKHKTMSFENGKGEFTQQAHYYQHHLVSAYDSLFYLKQLVRNEEDIVETISFISEHMQPHLLKDEKSVNKYKEFVGEEFWNRLMILHEADLESR